MKKQSAVEVAAKEMWKVKPITLDWKADAVKITIAMRDMARLGINGYKRWLKQNGYKIVKVKK